MNRGGSEKNRLLIDRNPTRRSRYLSSTASPVSSSQTALTSVPLRVFEIPLECLAMLNVSAAELAPYFEVFSVCRRSVPKRAIHNPRLILGANVHFEGLVDALIEGLQNGSEATRIHIDVNIYSPQQSFHGFC